MEFPEHANLAARYNSVKMGQVVNQGKSRTCWAVSVANCADILRRIYLLQNLHTSIDPKSDFKKYFSPQEIINYYHNTVKPSGVPYGYLNTKAIEYIYKWGVPWVERCPYRGLVDRDDSDITHSCSERYFPFKKEYDNYYLEYSSNDYDYTCRRGLSRPFFLSLEKCDAEVEPILLSRPILMVFAVGAHFGKWDSSEIYKPEYERRWIPAYMQGSDLGSDVDNFDQDGRIDLLSGTARWNPYNKVFYHTMVAVDSGVEGDQKFWVVKNSAGKKWGDGGYGRVLRCPSRNPFIRVSIPYLDLGLGGIRREE